MKENVMRAFTIAFVLLLSSACLTTTTKVQAQTSDACKKCGEQQTACRKNYSAKTCTTEYNICIKGCQKK
jgi:hypothetical protein